MPARFIQSAPNPAHLVIGCHLKMPNGESLQTLYPANSILDLALLERSMGCALTPSPATQLLTLQVQERDTVLGNVAGVTTLMDHRLGRLESLELSTQDGLITISQSEFQTLLPVVSIQTLASDVADIHKKGLDDQGLNQKIHNLTGRRVKQTLADTIDLPALPQTAVDIIRLKLDANAGLDELAEVIERDPSIAAQVVSWANSPYYAAPGKVKSVSDAVIRVLGYDMVMNLALGLSLGRVLDPPDYKNRSFNYWEQSVLVAASMQTLARSMPPALRPNLGEAYLTGLLHNFGDLLLAHLFEQLRGQIDRTQAANPHLPSWFVDQHLLGLAREDIGAEMLTNWQIPTDVCQAIRLQHRPDVDESSLGDLLFLCLRHLEQAGIRVDAAGRVPPSLYERFELTAESASKVIESMLTQSDALLGLARTLDAK